MHMTETRLGDMLTSVRNGLRVRQDREGNGLPITRIETIASGEIDVERFGYAGVQLSGNDQWLLHEGDLLMSHINSVGHLGKCALYSGEPPQVIHGMNLLNLRPDKSRVEPRYLLHALRSPCFRHQIPRITKKSVNQASFSISALKDLTIPFPSLEEQKRIAAILDKADAIRRKRQEVSVIARDAIRDFFLHQFGDPVSNPKKYDSVPIADVAKIVTGNTPSRKEPENYGGGIEWIKSDNINTPFHYLTESTERLSQIGEKKSRPVPEGSTLVTCIAGSPDCIGNAALADRRVASNQQINAAVPGDRLVDKFLYSMILVLKPAIQRLSSKSMKGMVSKGRFETLQVIVPPKSDQETFANNFDRIVGIAKKMDIAAGDADDLFNSLVQRAFRGNL